MLKYEMSKNLKKVMVCDGIFGESAHGLKMAVALSNSFYVVFCPILAPVPNFIKIQKKNTEVENF